MTAETESSVIDGEPRLTSHTEVRKLRIASCVALIAIETARAWFTRYELTPDSMSYLDIARGIAEGHFGDAISSYWSPGYPVLVSLFLWLFRPNAYWEFPLVHFVNLLIFVGTLGSFQIFWNEALRWHRRYTKDRSGEIPEFAFWAIGYAVFGIAIANIITVGLVAPDLLVSGFCLLAGSATLRFRRTPSLGSAIWLGFVLALGYYAKAPFLPMGIVFLLCVCLSRPLSSRIIVLAATAAATFLLICSPLVVALSRANGRLTFGDSARLNQAFYINGVQYFRHWQGGPPGSGSPIHPTRKLNDFPQIYEFAADDMGTYPPWYAPTYWNAGIHPHLDLRRQVAVFTRNMALEFQIIMESGAELVCVAIILALLTGYRWKWAKAICHLWFIWAPGAFALLMFALVHVEPRFLGGWLVILFGGIMCATMLPEGDGVRRAVWCIGMAAIMTAGAGVLLEASREAVGIDHAVGRSSEDASIAIALLQSGLHPGDHVALIGDGTGAYWAHLARLRIIAEIPASSASRPGTPAIDFWESAPDNQQKALEILEQTGAKVVIAGANPSIVDAVPTTIPSPWKRVDGTRAYIYAFPMKR